MSIKKTTALLVGSALALASLAACNSGGGGDATSSGAPAAADTSSAAPADEPAPPADEPAAPPAADGDVLIGITMPTKSLERWNRDGARLQEVLEQMGYRTQLDYADNKPDIQVSQLENQINLGAQVLVVASIDSGTLGPVLQTAKDKGISIIAYDRLLMDTPNVDYYATFDNAGVGAMQGQYMEDKLGLKSATGPIYLEPFAGSDDDNNAGLFFGGAWDILNPYVESGVLVVASDKAPKTNDEWTSIAIHGWDTPTAMAEMENRLNSAYTDKKVNAVLSPNDSLAMGIAQALEGAGYTEADWPIITGQDCDEANVKNILAGKQSMCVFKDTRLLAARVAEMVDQIVKGQPVPTEATYDNKVIKAVPTAQLNPVVVDKDSIQAILVDTAFYTAAQLGL